MLSTGTVAAAVGSPDNFASTEMGGVGSPYPSELAQAETFDAVGYAVTLVQDSSRFHVRFGPAALNLAAGPFVPILAT